MKPVGKDDQIFEVLRELPTEISLEKVGLIVTSLPPLPIWKNWLHYFNLNTILMSAITTTIILAGLLLLSPKEQEHNQAFTPITASEETISLSPEEEVIPQLKQKTSRPVKQLAMSPILPLLTQGTKEVQYSNSSLAVTPFTLTAIPLSNLTPLPPNDQIQLAISPNRPGLMIPVQQECDPPLELTKENQKRLKQQIRRSLLSDHLILSKKESIIIEVSPGEIIVNGQTLDNQLYQKYSLILHQDVPPCPGRHLVIGKAFIGIGHFTSAGHFIGISSGPLPAGSLRKSLPANRLLDLSIEDDSSTELFPGTDLTTSLLSDDDLINTNSLSLSESQDKKGNTFGLSWAEMQQLKRKLLSRFIKDNLIEAKQKKAILTYTKEDIVVNGKALTKNLAEPYRELLTAFRLNASPRRQIHIAPKFIIIGDFTSKGGMTLGQASGKDMIVNQRKPSGLYADDTFRLIHAVEDWH